MCCVQLWFPSSITNCLFPPSPAKLVVWFSLPPPQPFALDDFSIMCKLETGCGWNQLGDHSVSVIPSCVVSQFGSPPQSQTACSGIGCHGSATHQPLTGGGCSILVVSSCCMRVVSSSHQELVVSVHPPTTTSSRLHSISVIPHALPKEPQPSMLSCCSPHLNQISAIPACFCG